MLSDMDLKVKAILESKKSDLDFRRDELNHKIPDKKSSKPNSVSFKPAFESAMQDIENGKTKSFDEIWTQDLVDKFGFDKNGNKVSKKIKNLGR